MLERKQERFTLNEKQINVNAKRIKEWDYKVANMLKRIKEWLKEYKMRIKK